MHLSSRSLIGVAGLILALPVAAQQGRVLTSADYDRAARLLSQNVGSLVVGGRAAVTWLPDDRFWYRSTAAGAQYLLVDPVKRTKLPLFDHAKLAASMAQLSAQGYDATRLSLQGLQVSDDAKSLTFNASGKRYSCTIPAAACTSQGDTVPSAKIPRNAIASPDGARAAFIRNWNLFVVDVKSGQETQLTTDGVENFGYATDNAGWRKSDRPVLKWSPDSKKIATFQQDERNVGEMYLVETRVGKPVLQKWKYPLPGDSVVAMVHRVIIEVASPRVVRLQMPPDYHRATLGDDISMDDYQWSADGARLALVSTGRDHKNAIFRMADASTGAVKTLFEEVEKTHYESNTGWRVLWATNEILWYSQRDDWGHLYLYDLNTGALKHQITSGEGPVTDINRLDEKTRTLWVTALGRVPGRDPYFRQYYRVGLDGKGWVSLTPDDADHEMQLSPSGKYLVDTYSRIDLPPVVTVRDGTGKQLMELEKADISKLLATGWRPPLSVKMKGRDGKTDIYGMLWLPTNFDSTKKYPIVNNAYPGPQSGSISSRSFTASHGDKQAMADLGFVVVSIDGMGTPNRSKSFHDAYYGAMGRDNTLPDQVGGMKQLAERYSWIDIDKAGMYGHSGGGFITADAMFRYPDFFKVGVSQSGNHDQRNYEDDWGERYQGLLQKTADGKDNYEVEANQVMAKNLKGKLLLAHGALDDNVPHYATLLVAEALIKANKDFDLILFPNHRHGYGEDNNYMMRRRWDYFVKWLMGAEPPKEWNANRQVN